MTTEEIEDYITHLDYISRDYCVSPENQTQDCCDCYLCRVAFFNRVREELKDVDLVN